MFELNFLPRDITDDELYAEVRRVDTIVGKPRLTTSDFQKHSKINAHSLKLRFGDWSTVLSKANLGHKYSGTRISDKMRSAASRSLSNDEVLDELRRIAALLQSNAISTPDIADNSRLISVAIVRSRFGSLRSGLHKAGLSISPNYHRRLSNEEYFENLLSVWTSLGRQPFYSDMRNGPSEISPEAYANRFGTWRDALTAFVARMNGVEPSESETAALAGNPEPDGAAIQRSVTPSPDRLRQIPIGLRFRVLARDRFKCVKCGASPATEINCRLHVDHIIPFSRGGATTIDNLQAMCEVCNLGKGNRHLE